MGTNYQFINFLKKNFIIKKGGIANMNLVVDVEVKILYSAINKDGVEVATINEPMAELFLALSER